MGSSEARLAFVRPACGHSSRPQPLPAPPTPTPAAGERRPGGRRGLRPERRKVSGGRARTAPGCRGRDAVSRELVGGESAPAAGGCAAREGGRLAGRREAAPSGQR